MDEGRIHAWDRARAAARVAGRVVGAGPVPVEALMSRPVITVSANARLRTARDVMGERHIHHLLVEDRGRIVGIISDRDVARAISPYAGGPASTRRDDTTLERPVYHAASFQLTTVQSHAPIEEAAALFVERGISALPVVDEVGGIIGIVTTRDILRGLLACLLPERGADAA